MDFNSILTPKVLEFYTYFQAVHGGKYSTEFYGIDRYMYINKTIINYKININTNIKELIITLTNQQQTTFTIDQLLISEKHYFYSEIDKITIHSHMTITSNENDHKSR